MVNHSTCFDNHILIQRYKLHICGDIDQLKDKKEETKQFLKDFRRRESEKEREKRKEEEERVKNNELAIADYYEGEETKNTILLQARELKRRQGYVRIDYPVSGRQYVGEISKEDERLGLKIPHGYGELYESNDKGGKKVYEGMWRRGTMTGKGTFYFTEKFFFQGFFFDGKKQGMGTLIKKLEEFDENGNNEERAIAFYNRDRYVGTVSDFTRGARIKIRKGGKRGFWRSATVVETLDQTSCSPLVRFDNDAMDIRHRVDLSVEEFEILGEECQEMVSFLNSDELDGLVGKDDSNKTGIVRSENSAGWVYRDLSGYRKALQVYKTIVNRRKEMQRPKTIRKPEPTPEYGSWECELPKWARRKRAKTPDIGGLGSYSRIGTPVRARHIFENVDPNTSTISLATVPLPLPERVRPHPELGGGQPNQIKKKGWAKRRERRERRRKRLEEERKRELKKKDAKKKEVAKRALSRGRSEKKSERKTHLSTATPPSSMIQITRAGSSHADSRKQRAQSRHRNNDDSKEKDLSGSRDDYSDGGGSYYSYTDATITPLNSRPTSRENVSISMSSRAKSRRSRPNSRENVSTPRRRSRPSSNRRQKQDLSGINLRPVSSRSNTGLPVLAEIEEEMEKRMGSIIDENSFLNENETEHFDRGRSRHRKSRRARSNRSRSPVSSRCSSREAKRKKLKITTKRSVVSMSGESYAPDTNKPRLKTLEAAMRETRTARASRYGATQSELREIEMRRNTSYNARRGRLNTVQRKVQKIRRRRNPGVQTAIRESDRFKPVRAPKGEPGKATPFHFPRTQFDLETTAKIKQNQLARMRKEREEKRRTKEMLTGTIYTPGYDLRKRLGTLRPGTRYMGLTYLDKDKPPEVIKAEQNPLPVKPPLLFDSATRRSMISSSYQKDKKNSYLPPSEWTDDTGFDEHDYIQKRNEELDRVYRLPGRPWHENIKRGPAYGLYVPPQEVDAHKIHEEKMKDAGYRIQQELKADNAALRNEAKKQAFAIKKWKIRYDRWDKKHDVKDYFKIGLKRPGTMERKILEKLKDPLKKGRY
eukprot:g5117.t1